MRTAQEARREMCAVVGENQGAAQEEKSASCAVDRARGVLHGETKKLLKQ